MIHGHRRPGGFTILELIITIGIATIVVLVTFSFASRGLDGWRQSSSRAQSQEQVRRALDTVVTIVREARAGDNGAYALAQVEATALTFYANADGDADIEQVQFSLSGTSLQRRVIEPSGQPVQYLVAGAVTQTIVPNVRALSFQYYDKNYNGTGSALAQPVSPLDVRFIRVTVTVDDDPNRLPEAVTATTAISLRNLKDNL